MSHISYLRALINHGWTIANRKVITSNIGKANFDEVINLAHSANIADTFRYPDAITHLEPVNIQKTKSLLIDIIASYKEYAKSPYINEFLRTGATLSEHSQKILQSLKLAIMNNRVTGKFIRGISPTRANRLETIEDVSKFIFDNKGFTSAVPEINSDYANCFALGRNGVKVIFDVKNFPGYKASNYEVLFDTNAFTSDKFDIIKEGENLFRVVEKCKNSNDELAQSLVSSKSVSKSVSSAPPAIKKDEVALSKEPNPLPEYSNYYMHIDHKSKGGLCLSPEYLPKDYVIKTKSGDYEFAPCYKLDKLWAKKKGDGTFGVQKTVLASLDDNETCGRVLIDACCLDGKTAPGAFYYKLGFRFNNPCMNKECEQWIKSGGKYQDAPFCIGYMHLPKENIEHCLKYGDEQYYYKHILPMYEEEIKRALL